MPNWVYNKIDISGEPDAIAKFKEQAGKPYPVGLEENGELEYEQQIISFFNFIAPPQEAIESGEYFGTHGYADGKAQGDTPNNWYNFQCDKWGTKWNACNPDLEGEDETSLTYRFDTAWSPPEPVFEAMVKQFPDLDFEFWWEEEQGFGAELSGSGGELAVTKEWDSPNSHNDYYERDDLDGCACSHNADPHDWFDDCEDRELELKNWHRDNGSACKGSCVVEEKDLVY
jgi:hypothetical protein